MKRAVAILLSFLWILLAVSVVAPAIQAQQKAEALLILISIDGLRPD